MVKTPIGFLSLPENAMKSIIRFLNDKSLLAMREVNKFTKEYVHTLIKSRSVNFECFQAYRSDVAEETDDKMEVIFEMNAPIPLTLFKVSFISSSRALGIADTAIKNYSNCFVVPLNLQNLKRFLEYMKPFSYETKNLRCCNIPIDAINLCLDFLNGKMVEEVTINPRKSDPEDRTPPFELLRKVRMERIAYGLQGLTKDTAIKLMMHLAATTDQVGLCHCGIAFTAHELAALYQEMLSRKCTMPFLGFLLTPLAPCNVERLIQFVSHLEKKVSFCVITENIVPMFIRIGVYNVTQQPRGLLCVEHVNIS